MNMCWIDSNNSQIYNCLQKYSNKMGQIGICNFFINKNNLIENNFNNELNQIILKNNKVKWLLTIQNKSKEAIINLINNEDNQNNFLIQLENLLKQYCVNGIDLRFKNCGGIENQNNIKNFFNKVYNFLNKKKYILNICLPPITKANNSIHNENWCAYEDYINSLDTVSIMSCDNIYSYSNKNELEGICPKNWLNKICSYALKCFNSNQILLGINIQSLNYSLNNQDINKNLNFDSYYEAIDWIYGNKNYNNILNNQNQNYIPFISYLNENEKYCYSLPYIYNYINPNYFLKIDNKISQGEIYIRPFKDKQNNFIFPNKYCMIFEFLRQEPRNLELWFDNWTKYNNLINLNNYYNIQGQWTIADNSYLKGQGQLILKNNEFNNGKVTISIKSKTGLIGPTYENYWACCDFENNQIKLFYNNNLIQTISENLNKNNINIISLQVRENSIRIYYNNNLIIKVNNLFSSIGLPGLKSLETCEINYLQFSDAWIYKPQESFNIFINNNNYEIGRIKRTNIEWNKNNNTFKLTKDIEEKETRIETISNKYIFKTLNNLDFEINKLINFNYEIEDSNVNLRKIYIGDDNGCSIIFYNDANILSYWNNQVKHKYNMLGTCIDNLGKEDKRIWDILPNYIST